MRRGIATEFLLHGIGAPPDSVERTGTIERHTHRTSIIGECLEDGAPNPPDGVRDELDASGPIELLRGANETEVALIDQVGKRDPLVLELLRDRHDEAKIRADQPLHRVSVSGTGTLREIELLGVVEQRVRADVAQIAAEWIAGVQALRRASG